MSETNRYLTVATHGNVTTDQQVHSYVLNETKLYKDADTITDGASNPIAVAGALHEMMQALCRTGHAGEIKTHPAILCVFDQLHYVLTGYTAGRIPLSAYDDLAEGVKRFAQ